MIFSRSNTFVKGVIWAVVLAFVVSIFVIAGISYFSQQEQSKQRKRLEDMDASGKLKKEDAEKALVKVNDKAITTGALFDKLEKMTRMSPNFRQMYSTKAQRLQFLEQLIALELRDQAISEVKIEQAEVDAEVQKFVEKQKFPSKAELVKVLEAQGLTLIQFENDQIKPTLQIRKMVDKLVNPRELTEDKLKAYFEAHKDKFRKETTVEGKTISVDMEFDEARSAVEAAMRETVSDEELQAYFEAHKERFREARWVEVSQILVKEGTEKRKATIQPTDAELQEYYRGKRHEKKYQSPSRIKVAQVLLKFDDPAVLAKVDVTDEELTARYEETKADYTETGFSEVSQILINPAKITLQMTDDALQAFYARRNTVDCRHILVGLDQETLAVELKKRLLAGEDFAALAKEYSTDPGSKDNGGVYTDVARGKMVKPFEDAIFTLEKGQVSDPVKTNYGYHVIRVDATKGRWDKPFADVKAEVEKAYLAEEKGVKAEERCKQIRTEIENGLDFAAAAQKYSHAASKAQGGKVGKVYFKYGNAAEYQPAMSGEIAINGIVLNQLRNAVSALEAGKVTEAVKSPLGWHLLKVDTRTEDRVKSLDEVKAEVEKAVRIRKAEPLVMASAMDVYERSQRGAPFDNLARQFSQGPNQADGGELGFINLSGGSGDNARIRGAVSKDGATVFPSLLDELRKVTIAGKVLPPLQSELGMHVIRVEDIAVPLPKPFDEVKDMVRTDFITERDQAETKALADSIHKQLLEKADFAELAKKYSDGGAAAEGGKLGKFIKGEVPKDPERLKVLQQECMIGTWMLMPEFEEVIFTQPAGKVSEVFQSRLGYHIVLVTETGSGDTPEFASVKDQIAEVFTTRTRVSDDEIKTYYNENIADYTTPARLRLKTVVVADEAKAQEIRKRIVEGKEDISVLAKEFSKDEATRERGGDSGLQPEGSFDQALQDAVASLDVGKVAEPVKISAGYVVAQLVEKKPEEKKDIATVHDEIKDRLMEPKRNAMLEEYLKELRNKAKVEYFNENFRLLEKY